MCIRQGLGTVDALLEGRAECSLNLYGSPPPPRPSWKLGLAHLPPEFLSSPILISEALVTQGTDTLLSADITSPAPTLTTLPAKNVPG